ncbi:hypothetical protein [Pseudonocardia humida]|uniref:Uncharacterized protein n=1 Tax=Pseudonocardia humida TaxID=2800819 RepID=A0ABT1ACY7_9PSEU|nr:hypothetical protein [Pseudonocardia humida]MCO1660907.1 hypothetical protein [Pseudonocardia humida]
MPPTRADRSSGPTQLQARGHAFALRGGRRVARAVLARVDPRTANR